MNKSNDMCFNKVQLDLAKMIDVCAGAIVAHRSTIEIYLGDLDELLREGEVAKDPQEKYHARCAAHSKQENLLRETKLYCEAVDEYFYLTEAAVREEVVIVRENQNNENKA